MHLFLMLFFFTRLFPFFLITLSTGYIQEAGEGTSPLLSLLYPFVMIWNKKYLNDAVSDIGYISSKRGTEHPIYICLFPHTRSASGVN